eukprot:scaffold2441_cov105-Cylindrotheca_fusiformis.AAC.9
MKESPSRISKQDLDIRNKALHLLQQMEPDEKVRVSYGEQQRGYNRSEREPLTGMSYQNSAEALEREREAQRRHTARMAAEEDWTGSLMPVVSCVSEACKVGITGIAQQAAAGVSMMRKEAEEKIFTSNSNNIQGRFETVGVPSYQGGYADVPSSARPAGQKTAEAELMSC